MRHAHISCKYKHFLGHYFDFSALFQGFFKIKNASNGIQ